MRSRSPRRPRAPGASFVSVVTEQGSELYALLVDQVREVLTLKRSAMEPNPPTLPRIWADHSVGIYRLDGRLMVVLDMERLLQLDLAEAA